MQHTFKFTILITAIVLFIVGCGENSDNNTSLINESSSSINTSNSSSLSSVSSIASSDTMSSSSAVSSASNIGNPSFILDHNDKNITLYYGENTKLDDTNIVGTWKYVDFDEKTWYVKSLPTTPFQFSYGVSEDQRILYLETNPNEEVLKNFYDSLQRDWNEYEVIGKNSEGCLDLKLLSGSSLDKTFILCR